MSVTDFGRQQPQQKLAWGHKAYEEYVEKFFFTKMLGQGSEAIIEHITELSKNSKGEVGAFFHLISRITGGGVVGDNQLKGRERTLDAHWQRVNFDQIRNGIKNKGRLADQKSVIQFRRPTRKAMALWLADTWEDQATKRITPLRLGGKDYYVLLAHENTMARWYRNELKLSNQELQDREALVLREYARQVADLELLSSAPSGSQVTTASRLAGRAAEHRASIVT